MPDKQTVDDYLNKITDSQRAEYERIRSIVKEVAPEAEEVISYGMPTFKYYGSSILHFGAFKNHMSIFPGAPLLIKEKLSDYKVSKGTIQFTVDHPLPESIIREIIHSRLAEVEKNKENKQ